MTKLMSRKEAAQYLGTTIGTLAVWACTGRQCLPYSKHGREVRYKQEDLDKWLKEQKPKERRRTWNNT